MAFSVPDLGYSFDALEPHIDARTMEIHHDKHHAAYVTNLNKALEDVDTGDQTIEQILQNLDAIPEAKRQAVINHGGGHANHSLFWQILTPGGAKAPSGQLASDIDRDFGSFDDFKQQFSAASVGQFGSGWGWLVRDADGKLSVMGTANQDSPYMSGKTPIIGLDVWEHAYYLNYQNRRPDYVSAFWSVVNWDVAGAR
ncbi:MAG: superoxide dismutase [Acidobacteriota bacterium]